MPDSEHPTAFPRSASNSRLRTTNEWQNDPEITPRRSSFILDDGLVQRSAVWMKGSKSKRLPIALVVLALCSLILWVKVISPFVAESRSAWSAFDSESPAEENHQPSQHPNLPSLIQVQTLDPTLLPQSSKHKTGHKSGKKRLVFIGDIHGCKEELEEVLAKVRFDPVMDHLVSLGDIVAKGPDSLGVIDLLRGYGASCVRGNHDDDLILAAQSLRTRSDKDSSDTTDVGEVHEMAKSLNADQLKYLESCPIILRIGELKAFKGEAIAVHAGLVPGLALESQNPTSAMNMRIIDLKTHVPSEKHKSKGSTSWHKLWNKYQRLLSAHGKLGKSSGNGGRESEKRTTIIYGHNAREGLQIHKYTKGIDTGCVRGEKLTALVVSENGKQEIVQVKSRQPRLQADKNKQT